MNDTSLEIENMQFEMMLRPSSEKGIAFGCEMFMAARDRILASLPKNLSDKRS